MAGREINPQKRRIVKHKYMEISKAEREKLMQEALDKMKERASHLSESENKKDGALPLDEFMAYATEIVEKKCRERGLLGT